MKACSLLAIPLLAALAPTTASAYTPPRTSDILFSVNTDTLPASGATGNWASYFPGGATTYGQMGSPQVQTRGTVKWEKNVYQNTGFTIWGNQPGTYTVALPVPADAPAATQGATIVTVVKPTRSGDGGNWRSIVDVMYDQLVLGIANDTGQICVRRQGNLIFSGSGITIPNNQNTVLSLIVAADGTWKVWANGTLVWDYTATTSTFTSLAKSGLNATAIGRNNYDGWTTFNGNIGDTFMYTVALNGTDRAALETDLMAKFHAGASYPANTITASSTGGTISPTGAVSVPYEADQTFTFAPVFGKSLDVVVDSSSQGSITTYTFNTVIVDTHTIAATYTDLPTRTISGNVAAAAGGGATVSVKLTASSLASLVATTDASGNYTMTVPEGAYSICASQTGYMISADTVLNATGNQTVSFTLTAGRSIPQMDKLLFAADSGSLGSMGTSGNWPLLYSTYPAISTLTAITSPTVTKVRGIKYDLNQRGTGGDDGYLLNTAVAPSLIPTSGATVIAVVKPIRNTQSDGWNSVVDIFRDNLILGVKNNTGQIQVRRNGTDYWSTNDPADTLADGQLAILSLVVQPDGQFKVWCSKWNSGTNQYGAATAILSSTATSAFTAFVPAQFGPDDWRKYINIGRNNGDGWTSFNGYIGDTFVYKTALSDADCAILETDINTKTTSIPAYNITASAGANGSISPPGVTAVGETDSQSYTITPAWGYDISDVSVTENGVTSSKGAVTTYTFNNVFAVGSISASFVAKPTYAVTGKVTDGANPIAGAKVYVSTTANASVSPLSVLTTDASGNYSVNLFNATWYVCASATGYTTSADTSVTVAGAAYPSVNFVLAASGKNIPEMDQLLFAMYGTALPGSTQPWPIEHPKGVNAAVMGTPLVTTVDGVQWEQNRYATYDGYRVGYYTSVISVTGLSATAVVQPQGDGVNGGNWASVIDVMYSRFILCVRGTDGKIRVCRNGEWQDSATSIPNGQKTILTAVVQPTGQYQVFANGIKVMDIATTSAMTSLDPTWNAGGLGFWSYINVGRNNPDTWTTYQGNIGAALLWKTALPAAERRAFETQLAATFGITLHHTITASAGANGAISPTGAVSVTEGSNQTFTINPDSGFMVDVVTVDDMDQSGHPTSYTFNNVSADHTIAATFIQMTPYQLWLAQNGNLADTPANFLAFAFGTAPGASGPAGYNTGTSTATPGQPTTSVTPGGSSVDFRAVFSRRHDYATAGLSYTLQFSSELNFGDGFRQDAVITAANGTDVKLLGTGTVGGVEVDVMSVAYPWLIPVGSEFKKPTFFRVMVNQTPSSN